MRSRGTFFFLGMCGGALAVSGVAFLACSNPDDSLPPLPSPHYGEADGSVGGGGGDAASPADSGQSVTAPPKRDGSAGDTCVETTSASAEGGITVSATLPFDPCGSGSPDALFWDSENETLYIADDRGNQIWRWTDASGFQKLAKLPDDPAADDAGATKISGITVAGPALILARYGNGKFGALFQYDLGTAGAVATTWGGPPDPTRFRTGVAYDPVGQKIYSASYGAADAGEAGAGSVDVATLTGTTPFASGLLEPRGLLVSGTTLFVSDGKANRIYAVALTPALVVDAGEDDGGDGGDAAPAPLFPTAASFVGPDQLSAGPAGTFFAGQQPPDGGAPLIHQIFADGGVASLSDAGAFTQLGGIAFDATNHRLFVADSNGGSVRTIKIIRTAQ